MKNSKFKEKIIIVCLIGMVLLGFIDSYAYFISTGINNQKQITNIQTGNMELIFEDGNNGINKSLNFGESITKTFTIENTGSLEARAKINWLNLVNTYLKESLTYTLARSETEGGEYTEIITNKKVPVSETVVTKTLANNLIIPAGAKYYYNLEITLNYLEDIDQTSDLNAMLSTEFILEEYRDDPSIGIVPKMVKAIINDEALPENAVKEGNPNFAESATTDETQDGLYAMEDNYGTSYYFRGAVENNYVKFGDFYWRIIRINGDGSLRIIYDGTSAHTNGDNNTDRLAMTNIAWSNANGDAKYVGYMFGGNIEENSTKRIELGQDGYEDSTNAIYNETSNNIKIQLENWYKENIKNKGYDNYIADSIFCNDRTLPGKDLSGWDKDTGLGYGNNATIFGASARIISASWGSKGEDTKPSLICQNKNDMFTKTESINGNGKLEEKVGLITLDEAVLAGEIVGNTNTNFYLYKGPWYWTLSPRGRGSTTNAYVFGVNNIASVNKDAVTNKGGVAPVINLTPEYVSNMIGDGTIGNEYRLN